MLSREDNERITRTGAGTPMGETFRRYWVPAALSTELPAPDGAPLRVRVPPSHRFVSKTLQRCNYLQGLEGGLDSSHATIMHREDIGDRSWLAVYESLIPRIDVERTDYGFIYTGIRQYASEQWV